MYIHEARLSTPQVSAYPGIAFCESKYALAMALYNDGHMDGA